MRSLRVTKKLCKLRFFATCDIAQVLPSYLIFTAGLLCLLQCALGISSVLKEGSKNMSRTSWKCLLIGAVVAIALWSVAPQADAQWWGCCRPAAWGCGYTPCYSSCYSSAGAAARLLWRRVVSGMPAGTGPPVAVRSLPLVLGRCVATAAATVVAAAVAAATAAVQPMTPAART